MGMDRRFDRRHKLRFADVVRGAGGFIGAVGGTSIVKIFLSLCRDGFAYHVLPTVGTEDQTGQRINRCFGGRYTHILPHKAVYRLKFFLCHDSFMGILNDNP